ncbi:MAG: hypothetical protein HZB16_11605 [Armatimonadetes bacterium]|nr:hypothetical protein [Armatimonadota bacterium]
MAEPPVETPSPDPVDAPDVPAPTARPSFSRRELSWALGFAVAIAVLTSLPYLWALITQKYGYQYLGFVYNPDEPNVHLSWIRQAQEGALFFRNEFTSEPHVGRFFNLFMLALGRLAALAHTTPYAVWAAARVVAAIALCLAIYAAMVPLTRSVRLRRQGVVLVALSAGLGWLVVAWGLGIDAVDVEPNRVMPEAITFLSLYLNPLFTSSMLLLLGAMLLGADALRRERWLPAVGAGLLGLLLANVHTYDVIPLCLVLTAWLIDLSVRDGWRWRRFGLLVVVLALLGPAVVYQAHLIHGDPLYAAKANTVTATPPLLAMLLSYGLLLPLAVVGARRTLRMRLEAGRFLCYWAVLHFACIYLPATLFPFQRKMIEGFHLPLALLATLGVRQTARWLAHGVAWQATAPQMRKYGRAWPVLADMAARRLAWQKPLTTLILAALMPSNLLFVLSTLDNVRTNNQEKISVLMPPFSLPQTDLAALAWLKRNSERDSVVLCMPLVGNYVPALIGRTVYVGHWAETINYGTKLNEFAAFMKGDGSADDKTAWLRENRIAYLFMGTYETAWTDGQHPQLPVLERVYPPEGKLAALELPPVQIFRVKPTEEAKPPAEATSPRPNP